MTKTAGTDERTILSGAFRPETGDLRRFRRNVNRLKFWRLFCADIDD